MRMRRWLFVATILAPFICLWGGCAAKKAARTDGTTGATYKIETVEDSPIAIVVTPGDMPSNMTYTVQVGDTLSSISQRIYGTPNHWKDIVHENEITDPGRLKAGMVLKIPDLKGESQDAAAPPAPEAQQQ